MKTTVIHHSADYDGIFCREIARKFLPNTELIGWDFKDGPLPIPPEGQIYILDLPCDRVFGMKFGEEGHQRWLERVIWIDHHKSSIETHNPSIPGYRIDGVAACRLAWQWFTMVDGNTPRVRAESGIPIRPAGVLPMIQDYKNREVNEPLAVRLAGEYDIWDKRDPDAELFQFGLRSRELTVADWDELLSGSDVLTNGLLANGKMLQAFQQRNDAGVMGRSFMVEFEGLKFLVLNTARCNSPTFASKDVPETGHDALMGFYFDGQKWNVSLYHAQHRKDIDLSLIAAKHGGGGHRGACGFSSKSALPFVT